MFKKFQLKNGMNVLLVESRKSPVVSIQMWVNTGSADEKAGEEGISHFIEHLVFKGTRKFKVGEIAAKIEGSGGELNAYTSFDQTVFYVTISKNFVNTGLEAIAEMMGFPSFDSQEIDNERDVVIEEIKRGNDNPQRQASRMLFEAVYTKHPYGVPVIGYEDVIRQVSREKLLEYYHCRYVPQNMRLIVVGDFESPEMVELVKQHYGEFENFKFEARRRAPEAAQKSARVRTKTLAFEETLFHVAWRAPAFNHADVPALDVMALIIGQGDSSRLNERLRFQDHSVNYIGAGSFTPKNPGFFAISGSLNVNNMDRAFEGIREEVVRFIQEGPSDEELSKAIVNMNSEDYYGLETVDGMARKYGTFEHLYGDYRKYAEFHKKINALKPEDIRKVARKYLKPATLTVALMSKESESELSGRVKKFTKELSKSLSARSGAARAKSKTRLKKDRVNWFPAASAKAKDGAHQRKELSGGGVLITRPNYDTPVVSFRCAFLGGLRLEAPKAHGATELLSRTWLAGAGDMSESEISRRVEQMASSLSSFGGRNSIGLVVTTLKPFTEELLDLFEMVLLDPKFEASAIEREKGQMLEYLRTRKDNPSKICIMNFMSQLFGDHPYGIDPNGTEESVKALSRSALIEHLRQSVIAGNFTACATGHLESERWQARMEKLVAKMKNGAKPKLKMGFEAPTQSKRQFESSVKEQAHIVIGFPGLTFTDPRRYALQMIQAILAGQGGRLFVELRDKASLAYSVSPLKMEGLDGGYFGAYIGCSPEKINTAIRMMREEFKKISEIRAPQTEIERARRYLVGRHDIDLQRNSALSAAMLFDELYGLGCDDAFHFAEKVSAVTADEIRSLSADIFGGPEILSCVGPQEPSV